nr:MAG TPA: hypothetical protein [Caudoviricetes sp.]DAR92259.1 MAG TPA: hypothetical protein [Caudoviricetes sp.]
MKYTLQWFVPGEYILPKFNIFINCCLKEAFSE